MREFYLRNIYEMLKGATEEQLRAVWMVLLRMLP